MRYFLLLAFLFGLSANAAEKPWTFLVWMNGDNNLCSYAHKDVAEMQAVDASAQANVIVAFDCDKQNDSELWEIQGQNKVVLDSGKEYDMGDADFLTATANEVFKQYPSEHRMLVLWNHGSGWKSMAEGIHISGISYDDQSGNHITTIQMGKIARAIAAEGNRLDILGYDACLMQLSETGYELNGSVDYVLASEETEPGDGWEYISIMNALNKIPAPLELSKAIIDGYMAKVGKENATLSLVDVAALEKFVVGFKTFLTMHSKTEIAAAMQKALKFYDSTYKDIGSFLNFLPDAELSALLKETVVYHKGASGLSIYYSANPQASYKALRFSIDTGWLR